MWKTNVTESKRENINIYGIASTSIWYCGKGSRRKVPTRLTRVYCLHLNEQHFLSPLPSVFLIILLLPQIGNYYIFKAKWFWLHLSVWNFLLPYLYFSTSSMENLIMLIMDWRVCTLSKDNLNLKGYGTTCVILFIFYSIKIIITYRSIRVIWFPKSDFLHCICLGLCN